MNRLTGLAVLCSVNTVTVVLIGLAASPLAKAQAVSPIGEVRVEGVELSDVGSDHIQATVRISASARDSATLRSVAFDGVTINGIRVQVPPVAGPIHLRAGQPIEGLPTIRAVLMYRELESLEPVRKVIREGKAVVHANIRARLELNLFQKVALMAGGAWVTTGVDQEVPVATPGGAFGRMAALGVLVAAEPVLVASQNAIDWRRNRDGLAGKVRDMWLGDVVSLETRYELKSRDGEMTSVRNWSLGFLSGKGRVIAPAEAAEPWLFDDTLAQALESGKASLDERKLEIEATPVTDASAPPRTFSMQRGEIRVVKKINGAELLVSGTTKRRYRSRFRNRDNNAVLLEIPGWKPAEPGLEIASSHSGEWQAAAVLRLDRRDKRNEPAVWLTEARLENGRYRIKDLVDETAFGSPLWIDGGVAGVVQDEGSAAAIEVVLKLLQ